MFRVFGIGVLIFTFSLPCAFAQNNPDIGWLDHWRSSSFSFGEIQKDDHGRNFFKVIGTGVMVGWDGSHGCIVTAKHVFYDPTKNWHPSELRVRYSWQEGKSVYEDVGIPLKLRGQNGFDLWASPADGSDIAAMEPLRPSGNRQLQAIPMGELATPKDIFEAESVVVLGYPGAVGNEYLVRAISRGGIVSWLDPNLPFDKPFLIDANIYPGNSGGPVIKSPNGTLKDGSFGVGVGGVVLLGIISKAAVQISDTTLQVPGIPTRLNLHQQIPVGGTGVVEPVSRIRNFLESLPPRILPGLCQPPPKP